MPISALLCLSLLLAPRHRGTLVANAKVLRRSRAYPMVRKTQVTRAQLHEKDFGRRVTTPLGRTPQILTFFLKVKSHPERLVIRISPSRSLAHPLRNKPARKKSSWRVVEPPKSRVILTQRLAAPSSRPRVWAGVRRSLISMYVPLLIPSAAEQRRAVGCVPCSCEKRERCCMGVSPMPYSHILWGRKRLSARLVG
jgi:hypothetical protein